MKISHISKVMSIAAPPQPSCSTTLSAMREASFINSVRGFGTASLYLFGGTQRLFTLKYLFGRAKIA